MSFCRSVRVRLKCRLCLPWPSIEWRRGRSTPKTTTTIQVIATTMTNRIGVLLIMLNNVLRFVSFENRFIACSTFINYNLYHFWTKCCHWNFNFKIENFCQWHSWRLHILVSIFFTCRFTKTFYSKYLHQISEPESML